MKPTDEIAASPTRPLSDRDSYPAVRLAWVWGISLIALWSLIAYRLDQPIWRLQRSQALLAFGAFKGEDLTGAEAWRLIASQWLHVAFPHMLLNAAMIFMVGGALERRTSALTMLIIGLGGGAAGLYFSSVSDPTAIVSGASQAYLALCGAVLLLLPRLRASWWVAVLGIVVALMLDLFASGHGAIKTGHWTAFLAGVVCAGAIVAVERFRHRPTDEAQ